MSTLKETERWSTPPQWHAIYGEIQTRLPKPYRWDAKADTPRPLIYTTFEDLRASEQDLQRGICVLQRSQHAIIAYQSHLMELHTSGVTIKDYGRVFLKEGRLVNMHKVPSEWAYTLPSGCEHWCLWFDPEDIHPANLTHSLTDFLISRDLTWDDIVMFQNYPANRTVPEIPHYQVIVRTT